MRASISRAVAILVTSLLAVGGILVTPMAASAALTSVTGSVLGSGDSAPINDAMVTMVTRDGVTTEIIDSSGVALDAAGTFTAFVDDESPNTIELLAEAPGFESQTVSRADLQNAGWVWNFLLVPTPVDPQPTCSLTGAVTTTVGDLPADAEIWLTAVGTSEPVVVPITDGTFCATVDAGEYVVEFRDATGQFTGPLPTSMTLPWPTSYDLVVDKYPPYSIGGAVTDENGAAVASGTVEVFSPGREDPAYTGTISDGAWSVDIGSSEVYSFRFTVDGYPDVWINDRAVDAGTTFDVQVAPDLYTLDVSIAFSAASSTSIYAFLSDGGGPVTGLQDITDGGFSFANLPAGYYTINVGDSNGEYPSVSRSIYLSGSSSEHFDLASIDGSDWTGNSLSGSVLDQNGNHVASGTIGFYATDATEPAFTADIASGAYTVSHIPPGTFEARPVADGFTGGEATVTVDGASTQNLTLQKSFGTAYYQLSGQVFLDGEAFTGATVELRGDDASEYQAEMHGSIFIATGYVDHFRVRATAPGYPSSEWVDVTFSENTPQFDLSLHTPCLTGCTISGAVTSGSNGVPAGTVDVYRASDLATPVTSAPFENGTYAVSGLTGRDYVLRFSAPGYQSRVYDEDVTDDLEAATPTNLDGDATIDIELQPIVSATISGKIRTNSTDLPVATVVLDRFNDDETWSEVAVATTSSLYSFDGLPTGNYRLTASTPLYDLAKRYVTVGSESVAVPLVLLKPAVRAYLRASGYDSLTRETVNNTLISAYRQIGAQRWGLEASGVTENGNLAVAGNYSYRLLLSDPSEVYQTVDFYGVSYDGDPTIATAAITPQAIAADSDSAYGILMPRRPLTTGVVSYYGTPVAGATVTFEGPISIQVTTGSDGSYGVYLPRGSYQLTASHTDYETPEPVNIESSGYSSVLARDIGFTHSFADIALSGVVSDQYGNLYSAGSVQLFENEEPVGEPYPIDEFGGFSIPVESAGDFSITATVGEFSGSTATYTVEPGRSDIVLTVENTAIDAPAAIEVQPVLDAAVVGTAITAPAVTWSNDDWTPAPTTWKVDGVTRDTTGDSYTPTADDLDLPLVAVFHVTKNVNGHVFDIASESTAVTVGIGTITPPQIETFFGDYWYTTLGYDIPNGVTLQWYRDTDPIVDETNWYHFRDDADYGHTVSVKVTFAAAGYTSVIVPVEAETLALRDLTAGSVAVSRDGDTVTAVPADWPTDQLAYQWTSDTAIIAGATDVSYALGIADRGHDIRVEVTATAVGYQHPTVQSDATAFPLLPLEPITPPSYTGTAAAGETLTFIEGEWPEGTVVSGSWSNDTGTLDEPSTHVIASDEGGQTLVFTGTASKLGYETSAVHVAVEVAYTGELAPGTVTVTSAGGVLTAQVGQWGPGAVATSVNWFRGDTMIDSGPTHAIGPNDLGQRITATITGSRKGFPSAQASGTFDVARGTFETTTLPIINTGDNQELQPGDYLTTDTDAWQPKTGWDVTWYRGATKIDEGVGHFLVAADFGASITAKITSRNAHYVEQTTESPALAIPYLTPRGLALGLQGDAIAGSTLTMFDDTGSLNPAATITWYRGTTLLSTTGPEYVVEDADRTSTINAVYHLDAADGYDAHDYTVNGPRIAGSELSPGTLSYTGDLDLGSTITGTTTPWAGDPTLTYSWIDADDVVHTGQRFEITEADLDTTVTLWVTATKPFFEANSFTLEVAIPKGDIDQDAPTITGLRKVGETLTGHAGASLVADITASGEWRVNGNIVANGLTYIVKPKDRGATLTFTSTVAKAHYNASVETVETVIPLGTIAAGTPTVTGTTGLGSILSATTGTWASDVTLTTRWLRNGVVIPTDTGLTHTIVAADQGGNLTFEVAASAQYFAATTVSVTAAIPAAFVAPVVNEPVIVEKIVTVTVTIFSFTATPAPVIKGTAKVGSKLSVATPKWKPSGVALAYQWYAAGKPIAGATGKSLKLAASVKGKKITVSVTGTKAGYATATVASKATKKIRK